MEEAEALCDRLGIFVDGSLQCIADAKEVLLFSYFASLVPTRYGFLIFPDDCSNPPLKNKVGCGFSKVDAYLITLLTTKLEIRRPHFDPTLHKTHLTFACPITWMFLTSY